MSNEDVERLIANEDTPPQAPVEEVLDAQRETSATGAASESGPIDLLGPEHPEARDEPAIAALINNTGDDGGASSG